MTLPFPHDETEIKLCSVDMLFLRLLPTASNYSFGNH